MDSSNIIEDMRGRLRKYWNDESDPIMTIDEVVNALNTSKKSSNVFAKDNGTSSYTTNSPCCGAADK